MNPNDLDKTLKRMTYRIELVSYFIKILKEELRSTLNEDEFSGLLCSGLVLDILRMIDLEFFKDKNFNEESLQELLQKENNDSLSQYS